MKAFYLHAKEDIRPVEVETPTPGQDEVLVAVRRVGICGSDIEYYRHFKCGAFVPRSPFVLGHELAGEVAELGNTGVISGNGQDVYEGARVAVDPSLPCSRCAFCRSGRYNLCTNMKFLGSASVDPHMDGAMRQYMVIPARNCYVLPESVSFAEGTLLEPLSIALHAARRAAPIGGRSALVFGGGTIGQLLVTVLRVFGATGIGVVDPLEHRRSDAAKVGADYVLDPSAPEFADRLREANPLGAEAVFEASGAPAAVRSAIQAVQRGGTLVQVGTITRDIEIPANLIMVKELDVLGSFRTAHEYGIGLDFVASKRIDVLQLLTHEFPMDEIQRAFAATQEPGSVKVHLSAET